MNDFVRPKSGSCVINRQRFDVFQYESCFDVIDEVERKIDRSRSPMSFSTHDPTFYHSTSWEDMKDKMVQGGLLENLEGYREHLDSFHEAMTEVMVHDVQGSFVDVGRFVNNEPECMVDFQEQMVNKYATILFQGGDTASVSSELIFKRACFASSLVDSLENRGIRCQVFAVYPSVNLHSVGYRRKVMPVVKVKSYNEPMHDCSMNTFHPAFFRRGIFGQRELITACTSDGGMASSHVDITMNPEEKKSFKESIGLDPSEALAIVGNRATNRSLDKALDRQDWKEIASYANSYINELS